MQFKNALFVMCLLLWIPQGIADPLVWKLNWQGKTSYLTGTMHATTAKMLTSLKAHDRLLKNSRVFISELNMQTLDTQKTSRQMVQMARWKNGLDAQFYSQPQLQFIAQKLAQNGLPEHLIETFKPWFIALRLSIMQSQKAGFDFNQSVDHALFKQAQRFNLEMLGLESVQQQIAVFNQFEDQGKSLLLDTLAQESDHKMQIETLANIWQQGDLDSLESTYQHSLMHYSSSQDVEQYLLKQRNQRWVNLLLPQLKQGNAYIAVGLMHMAGEYSLLKLLQTHGVSVTTL